MADSNATVREVRFVIEGDDGQGPTTCYVFVEADPDAPIGVQGWHARGLAEGESVRDFMNSETIASHLDWPQVAPPERDDFRIALYIDGNLEPTRYPVGSLDEARETLQHLAGSGAQVAKVSIEKRVGSGWTEFEAYEPARPAAAAAEMDLGGVSLVSTGTVGPAEPRFAPRQVERFLRFRAGQHANAELLRVDLLFGAEKLLELDLPGSASACAVAAERLFPDHPLTPALAELVG